MTCILFCSLSYLHNLGFICLSKHLHIWIKSLENILFLFFSFIRNFSIPLDLQATIAIYFYFILLVYWVKVLYLYFLYAVVICCTSKLVMALALCLMKTVKLQLYLRVVLLSGQLEILKVFLCKDLSWNFFISVYLWELPVYYAHFLPVSHQQVELFKFFLWKLSHPLFTWNGQKISLNHLFSNNIADGVDNPVQLVCKFSLMQDIFRQMLLVTYQASSF